MQNYQIWIIEELKSWAETFNSNYPLHFDDIDNQENEAYNEIYKLINKYSKNKCSKNDLENILFHLWQKNKEL